MNMRIPFSVIPILLACACPIGAVSAEEIPDSIPLELSPESLYALEQDAQRYASAAGIPPDRARSRFKAQMGTAELIAKLRATNKNRLAGIYTDYSNGNRIVVRLKGGGTHVREKTVRVGDEIVIVETRPGARYTLEEVQAVFAENMPAIQQQLPTMQGGFANEKATEVIVDILPEDVHRSATVASLLPGDIPIVVNVLPGPIVPHAMGGGHLDGGNCTTSFTVKKTGTTTTGVTTAGHCPNSNSSYSGADGAATTTFQAESWNASNDFQWHTASNASQAKFVYQKSGSTWSTRTLTGKRLQSSTSAGNNICHYGATSNYSCGDVLSTSYQPAYSGGCNGATCTATYVSVGPPSSGTGLACAGGDSGGPWFVSTVAVGIHSGGSSSGSAAGQCSRAIYMSTDRITALSLELVFGP